MLKQEEGEITELGRKKERGINRESSRGKNKKKQCYITGELGILSRKGKGKFAK